MCVWSSICDLRELGLWPGDPYNTRLHLVLYGSVNHTPRSHKWHSELQTHIIYMYYLESCWLRSKALYLFMFRNGCVGIKAHLTRPSINTVSISSLIRSWQIPLLMTTLATIVYHTCTLSTYHSPIYNVHSLWSVTQTDISIHMLPLNSHTTVCGKHCTTSKRKYMYMYSVQSHLKWRGWSQD